MSKFSQIMLLSISAALAGCGAESEEQSVNQDSAELFCPGSTFVISDIELTTSLYDRDGDGCLTESEHQVAINYANRVASTLAKELELDGTNTDSSISAILTMKVTGNAEVSDNKAQLHTNLDSGDFTISFKSNTTGSSDERLKLYFDDESAIGNENTNPANAFSFPLPPLTGDISYIFSCEYLDSVAVNCTNLLVTRTSNIGADTMTLAIDVTFPLSLTFTDQSLPIGGFIIGTFCDESGETPICLNNYAEIPVSFN